MEDMKDELDFAGVPVTFVAINKWSATLSAQNLTDDTEFPVFQDTLEVNAWELQGAGKDDMFVYDAEGHLDAFLPHQGTLSVNLSTDEGYQNLKDAVLNAQP
jgi:hypothetical protein